MYVGSPFLNQNACVHLEIVDTSLVFQEVAYSSLCSLDKNMQNGSQGTIPMLIGGIAFAKQMFPSIDHLELQDESGFTVRETNQSKNAYNRSTVILSERDIMLYGQTWYQKALFPLGLHPQTERGQYILNKYKRRLKPSWFANFKTSDRLPEYLKNDADFQKASDWQGFLSLKKKSSIYHDWISLIIREVLLLPSLKGMAWVADLKTLPFSWASSLCDVRQIQKPVNMAVHWGGKPIYNGPLDVPLPRI